MRSILYILLAISFAACSNNKKPETAQSYAATPNGMADLQKSAAASSPSPTTAAGSNLLTNPAHGEPGHDCSIAVGAPLKAAAKTTSPQPNVQTVAPQPTVTVNSTPQPVTSATSTVDTKGQKLNPAHGQPGHDCAIAVGAPLNSKPAQASTPKVTVTQPTAPTKSLAPVLNAKGQRLNPAHGQPGHKCEVAVGAPLT